MKFQNLCSTVNWTLAIAVTAMAVGLPLGAVLAAEDTFHGPPAKPDGKIVFRSVMVEDEDEDPAAAGKAAAEALEKAMAGVPLQAVVLTECFEDREYKEQLLAGVCSVLPEKIVLGGSAYGSFTQTGCSDFDSVSLLGIGGDGVSVAAALVTEMGASKLIFEEHKEKIKTRLHQAGAKLAGKLRKSDRDRLLILIPDAHAPKNQLFVEGVQRVVGEGFPITGGSANKNAGQTFVYFGGKLYEDSAVALMLSGDFRVALSGRKAKDNDRVISTARDAAAEAKAGLQAEPIAALVFNCAGRRSKLKNMGDELAAMQEVIGKELPLFGCYCAGEIGPLDISQKKPGVKSGGGGWHVMFTLIGR